MAEYSGLLMSFSMGNNEERPHSRLGYRIPAEFKTNWLAEQHIPFGPNHALGLKIGKHLTRDRLATLPLAEALSDVEE